MKIHGHPRVLADENLCTQMDTEVAGLLLEMFSVEIGMQV